MDRHAFTLPLRLPRTILVFCVVFAVGLVSHRVIKPVEQGWRIAFWTAVITAAVAANASPERGFWVSFTWKQAAGLAYLALVGAWINDWDLRAGAVQAISFLGIWWAISGHSSQHAASSAPNMRASSQLQP
jgi:hypothetical protein